MFHEPKTRKLLQRRGCREGIGQLIGLMIFVYLMFFLAACTTNTQAVASRIDVAIAQKVCTVWTPVTDTTSKQVRGNNRAHFAYCNGATMEKTK